MRKILVLSLFILAVAWLALSYKKNTISDDHLLVTNDEVANEDYAEIDNLDDDFENIDIDRQTLENYKRLAGKNWIWLKTITNDEKTIVPRNMGDFSLKFDLEGNMSGLTDCIYFFGPYTLDSSSIEMGPLASTLMYCEGSQEREFMSMVSSARFIFFDSSENLVLQYSNDLGSVIFESEN